MLVEAPVTRLPAASCTSTCTAGAIAVPLVVLVGCTRKLRRAGGPVTTVMPIDPGIPSTVAVIVAVPSVRPVTRPPALTRATAVSPLDQVTGRPLSGLPPASRGTALSCSVPVTGTVAPGPETTTDATVAGGPDVSELQATSNAVTATTLRSVAPLIGRKLASQPGLRTGAGEADRFFTLGVSGKSQFPRR